MDFCYCAYGLRLGVNQRIAGLVSCPDTSQLDLRVWLDGLRRWPPEVLKSQQRLWYESPYRDKQGQPILTGWELDDGAYLRLAYVDGTEFLLERTGTEIWTAHLPNSTLQDTVFYLLNPILGIVLRLRGVTCLHAGAVACDDRAILFLGPSDAGKSTTVAAFGAMGFPVLSDEIVALEVCDGSVWAKPAGTTLRLWPASIDALRAANCFPAELATDVNGRRYHLDLTRDGYRFQEHPLRVGAIYLLDERYSHPDAPWTDAIDGRDRLLALLSNVYGASLPLPATELRDFAVLGELANRVPVRRVHAHTDPVYLPKLCELIAEDARSLAASEAAIPLPA